MPDQTAVALYAGTSGPHLIPPYTLLGGPENMKVIFDRFAALMGQGVEDNQNNARAWANLSLRQATNAATIDNLAAMGTIISGQTGDTSNQQTTSPRRTGAGDTDAAGSATANRSVDNATAGTAQAASVGLAATFQQVLQAISDNNAVIAQAMQTLQKLQTSAVSSGPTAPASA
jgi:hypothetical protein